MEGAATCQTNDAEVPYVFGTLKSPAETDRRISDAMQEYWTNFAKTGNPGWRAFSEPARSFLEFTGDGAVTAADGLRAPFCGLYMENVQRLIKSPNERIAGRPAP